MKVSIINKLIFNKLHYVPVVGQTLHCLPKANALPKRRLQHSEKLVAIVPIGFPVQLVLR